MGNKNEGLPSLLPRNDVSHGIPHVPRFKRLRTRALRNIFSLFSNYLLY